MNAFFFFLKLSAAGLLNPSGSLARKREPCKGGEPCLEEPRGNQVFQGSCLNNLRTSFDSDRAESWKNKVFEGVDQW